MDEILTVEEIAKLLKVKSITVREMFREQRLRGFKVGKAWRTTQTLFDEDVKAFMRGQSEPGTGAANPRSARKSAMPEPVAQTDVPPDVEPAREPLMGPEAPTTTPGRETELPAEERGTPAKRPRRHSPRPDDTGENQQLLF